jgi:hypothetical protein
MAQTKAHKIIAYLRRQMIPNIGTVLLVALMLYVYNSAQASGQAPTGQAISNVSSGLITYQGMLSDKNGQLIRGKVDIVFRIYDTLTGGTALWNEAHTGTANGVQVIDGIFNVILGSLTPIPQNLEANSANLWLGITVGTDSEMTPRAQLGSVFYARQALTVSDSSITSDKIAAGAVNASHIADGAISKSKLGADASIPQIQSGVVCVYSTDAGYTLDSGSGLRTVSRQITFGTSFGARVPTVITNLQQIDSAVNYGLRVGVNPANITNSGFDIVFYTWDNSKIYDACTSWMAY